ncbi:uncharacterized protein [Arachis hypogaea]|uniref:uncharacterized protein n=1 Tax=Arachis hypogaea TaxID=3818 RepID=UPI003B224D49
MAELLRQMEHDCTKEEHKNVEHKEDNDKHTSETRQTTPKTTKTIIKRTNPFTKEVMSFKMPENLTLPSTLKPYQGIGGPNIHITKFYAMMFMNKEFVPILCRTFPTFLDGAALIWFSNLPEGSISNFDELANQLVNHFAASKIYVHNFDYLSTIKQGPNESLKDYMTRFAEATNKIPNLNSEVHLHALKSGLRPGKFQESIVIAKPKTLAEFQEKATTQIEVEEFRALRRAEKPTPNREEERQNRHLTGRTNQKSFRLTPKFDSYTPFNTKREDIVKDILHSKLIKPPNRAGTYKDQRHVNRSKYCAFHQKYGHTTDDCVIAKDVLEKLARQGLLDKYIDSRGRRRSIEGLDHQPKETDNSRDKGKKVDNDNNPPRRIINCISGGFAGGGCMNSARKRSYRAMMTMTESTLSQPVNKDKSEISFSPEDYKAADRNLDDPVVITAQVGEPLVKKILMDPGSSADVLFYSTFQKMNLSDKILQPSSGELVGFSGERVSIRGYIWLQTTFGDYPNNRTLEIPYLVVDCKSPYNIILGRPSLNAFNAVVSTVMPFGLKNVSATYQRLMDKIFAKQIGRNIEVYVDDMVAKSTHMANHAKDLTEIFQQQRRYNMKLNQEKCAFGVQSRKFLGFMLTYRGIEANPEKCQAILNMRSPKTVKEVQQLTGRLAALARFLPRIAHRSHHFFKNLKKQEKFYWSEECEAAFTELKTILSAPPILQTPEIGKPLYLYLSITNNAISSVLVTEIGKQEHPVYFVSKSLQNAETRYPKLEKLALGLVTTTRRL